MSTTEIRPRAFAPGELLDCGHPPTPTTHVGTGYGVDNNTGKTRCYQCCADHERACMIRDGQDTLYLSHTPPDAANPCPHGCTNRAHWTVTDWPGLLRFRVDYLTRHTRAGFYGMTYPVYHVRFIGPDGAVWSGRNAGNVSQLLHCKRTKIKR